MYLNRITFSRLKTENVIILIDFLEKRYLKQLTRKVFLVPLTQNVKAIYLGFTNGESTWLPINESYKTINVEDQLKDETSPLQSYKNIVQIRRAHEDLILWGTTSLFDEVR